MNDLKKNAVKLLSLLLIIAMTLCSCGAKEEEPAEEEPIQSDLPIGGKPSAAPEEKPEPVVPEVQEPEPEPEPEPQPLFTNPLTGLETETDLTAKRPVAVMINNHKQAQPTMSLSKADIIYEYIAEGGITRLLAIFQSLDGVKTVGTVRSARPYYLETVLAYDAIYVHAGGSDEAYDDMKAWNMDHMDGVRGTTDAKIFWRDSYRKSHNGYEHSLVTSGENISNYIEKSSMRKEHKEGYDAGLRFGEVPATALGNDALHLSVGFSSYKTGKFDYNAETGLYSVSEYGSPMKDTEYDTTLAVKNVLVLHTTSKVIDDYGRMSYQTTGSGTGNYYCAGKVIKINWSRSDRNSPFKYTKQDGSEFTFMPGNTYICVINTKASTETVSNE